MSATPSTSHISRIATGIRSACWPTAGLRVPVRVTTPFVDRRIGFFGLNEQEIVENPADVRGDFLIGPQEHAEQVAAADDADQPAVWIDDRQPGQLSYEIDNTRLSAPPALHPYRHGMEQQLGTTALRFAS